MPFNLRQIVEALCNAYNASQPFVKERILASLSDLETRVVGDVDFVRECKRDHWLLRSMGFPCVIMSAGDDRSPARRISRVLSPHFTAQWRTGYAQSGRTGHRVCDCADFP